MAIHYDAKSKRFRDERGRLVAAVRAMRSSVARREYEAAQRKKTRPKAAPKPAAKKAAPKKAAPKKAAKVSHAKPLTLPTRAPMRGRPDDWVPPWDREGIVKETPDDDEWYDDFMYGYDDLADDWGDYDDEDTDS